ncbi:MAG: DUF1127 domain-containing protein [Pseudomonadota bacterium]
MATTFEHARPSKTTSITSIFSVIFFWLVRLSENNPISREIEELSKLSDEELAARGLKRSDIAHKVLGNRIWL